MENTAGNSYNLSIRISSDGFSLSVNEESGQQLSTKYVAASLFTLSAEEIIKIMSIETQINCKNIRIICESDTYTFVPTLFFKSEDAAFFLNFQHKIPKNDRVIYNTIQTWDTVNIFTLPAALQQAIAHLFPAATLKHHMGFFLTDYVKHQPENSLYLWVRPKMLDVIVLVDGKLQLLNSYSYQTPEDFTYHTLNVVEQLSLDTEKCKVFLYNTAQKPEFERLLSNYLTVICI